MSFIRKAIVVLFLKIPDAVQMLAAPDITAAQAEHDRMVAAYRQAGVTVHRLVPDRQPPPNQMFMADLLFATPEGVILARPCTGLPSISSRQDRAIFSCRPATP